MKHKAQELGKQMVVMTVSVFAALMVSSAPVLASGGGSNFICDATALSGALESLLTVFVVVAGLAAIAGGTFFTLASAVKPGNYEEYGKNRNRAVLYGLGSLIVLYGGNAIVSQIDSTLTYDCILPFTGSS